MKNSDELKKQHQISRRQFLNRTAAGTALLAMTPVTGLFGSNTLQSGNWSADDIKYRFHMIGHAHIDPVWLWPWSEGVSVVHSTFQAAIDRMNETPGFSFVASSAQFYEWVAENDPQLLATIRKRVDEGRWNVIGGWWVEPDVNIPCGEAMVRQGLYGQLTLRRLLGHQAKVGFNPDSFGHAGTLPQIYRLQEMDNYVFMRPAPHEKALPADLFWWEGPDGSQVLTYRIQQSYEDTGSVRTRIETVLKQDKDQPMKSFMSFYGAGDHGGSASKENIRSIEELSKEPGAPQVFYSTIDKYFKEVREDKNLKLPVVKDDLQHHAVGCYTIESEIKKGNRQSESALITAEKIAALGSIGWGARYPKEELTSAWKRVLFLQFHDSLAGSSLSDHSQTACEGHGYALDVAHRAAYMALQKLEWQVAAEDPESQYLVVFNPHAWEVRGKVEYDFSWGTQDHKASRVEDELGNALPHQWTSGSSETGNRGKLVVETVIPSMGYRQIRLRKGDGYHPAKVATARENRLENDYLSVSFASNGACSIFDKENNKELFSGGQTGCRAVVIDDPSDTWSHDVKTFSNEIGEFGHADIKILENGPLRATLRIATSYGDSVMTVDWSLYAGSRNLEAKVMLDWHEHLKMLKFSFPVDVENPVATYETPYGHIIRATNGDEDPGQRWIDLNGDSKGAKYGLTLINDAKYGYNVAGNDMRISVLRSAVYAHHRPRVLDMKAEHLWMDQGMHTFGMLLVPYPGNRIDHDTVRLAEEFMAPPLAIYQGIHGGSLPKSGSMLSTDQPNVLVSSIKEVENGADLIFRCVETSGKQTSATIDLALSKARWTGQFRPFEIKSLRMNRKTGAVKEVNLLEE